jgi:Protein of unknown function (DUF1257)
MSHFTRIKTRLVEKDYLVAALKDSGAPFEEGGKAVRGWRGNSANAEIVVTSPVSGYDIGFFKNGESYEAVADWTVIGGRTGEFMEKLNQRYAYHATRAKLEAQGFAFAEEEQKDGRIRLVARRVV